MLIDKKVFENYANKNGMPSSFKDVLREFLQTQILHSLSLSKYSNAISFLGGTALRFGHNLKRFSEDLDFDLIKKTGFVIKDLEYAISNDLQKQGFVLDSRVKTTENIHIIYWRFSNVLRQMDLPVSSNEKFLIKFEIDYNPPKDIETEVIFVNKFDLNFPILFNNVASIYSQKVLAIMFRPYQKGRDFYDLIWFLSQKNVEPNYSIFKSRGIKISNRKELFAVLKKRFGELDLKQASIDVRRFLFDPREAGWIINLPEYIDQLEKDSRA